jgi:hypothetical protein
MTMKNNYKTKIVFVLLFIFPELIALQAQENVKSKIKKEERSGSIELMNTPPKFTSSSNSSEIKKVCLSIITLINNELPALRKVEKKIRYENVDNTPVTIWYSKNNLPVKIDCAVTDDSGKFTDIISFYFINGRLWYSDQIFARYIFDSNKLKYWMDENWNINEIPVKDFTDREMLLKSDIKKLLSD